MKNYSSEVIAECLEWAKNKYPIKNVTHFEDYLVMGQSPKDIASKIDRIKKGDNKGFFTIEGAFKDCIADRLELCKKDAKEMEKEWERVKDPYYFYLHYERSNLKLSRQDFFSGKRTV